MALPSKRLRTEVIPGTTPSNYEPTAGRALKLINPRIERHAASMRCLNAEIQRKKLWANLHRKQDRGELTAKEAKQMKDQFWAGLHSDLKLVKQPR